jgi:hypothetical protein
VAKKKPSFIEDDDVTSESRDWLDTFTQTVNFYKNFYSGWDTWKQGYRLFKGDHYENQQGPDQPLADNPRERITVNMIGSAVRSLLPFLVNRRPKFIATPRLPESLDNSKLQEGLLNYYWNEFNMQKQIELAITDCIIAGHGIVKTGFKLKPGVDVNPDEQSTIDYREFVREENPFIEAVSPFLFFWDPDAPSHDLDTARWCFQVYFEHEEDVLDNPDYDPAALRLIEDRKFSAETVAGFTSMNQEDRQMFANDKYEARRSKRLVIYDLWDKKFNEHRIYCGGIPKPLVKEPTPYPYLDGFPFAKIDFIRVPHEPFSLGLPFWMQDQQAELNRIRTYMHNHSRRFNRKYEVWTAGLQDENQLNALQTGQDGTLIKTKQPQQTIRAIEDAQMSPDKFSLDSIIKSDMKDIGGLDSLYMGAPLPSRTSATEVNTRSGIASTKIDEYVSNVDNFVREIGKQVLKHCQEYVVSNKVVQIMGDQGVFWKTATPEDIQADFILDLETTSKPKADPELEKSQYIQLFAQLIQLAQVGVQVDFNAFAKLMFQKFGISEGAKIIPGAYAPVNPNAPGGAQPSGPGPGTPDQQIQSSASPVQSAIAGAQQGGMVNGGGAS